MSVFESAGVLVDMVGHRLAMSKYQYMQSEAPSEQKGVSDPLLLHAFCAS